MGREARPVFRQPVAFRQCSLRPGRTTTVSSSIQAQRALAMQSPVRAGRRHNTHVILVSLWLKCVVDTTRSRPSRRCDWRPSVTARLSRVPEDPARPRTRFARQKAMRPGNLPVSFSLEQELLPNRWLETSTEGSAS
eukprot:g82826.t1